LKKAIELFLFVFFTTFSFCADKKLINVLCYHNFKVTKIKVNGKEIPNPYSITPENFEKQMKYLKNNGYNVISMKNFIDYMYDKSEIPEKAVLITIDDGYKNIYEYAYPILKKYKFPATIYIYKTFVNAGKNTLSFNEIKELSENGFEFGCHSNTHPVLTSKKNLTDEEYIKFLENEIIEPKKYLERKLRIPIETMSYPYGSYSKEIHKIVEKAGYKLAFSVVPSYNTKETNKYSLKRTMIYVSTTLDEFKEILETKQLKLKEFYPGDGDIIENEQPELKAKLFEDSNLNTITIKFKVDNVELKDSIYNPETKMLLYSYYENNKKLLKGMHDIKVIAKGKDDNNYEYAWLFIIGKPLKVKIE